MSEQQVVDLGYRPRPWQRRCHLERRRFTVLALHRRAGKTELAIMELVNAALRFHMELGLFVYVAPFLKQAKSIAWNRLKQRLEALRVTGQVEVNESELWVRFKHNGAMIRVFGGDNPDAMRGVRLDGAVIDEVAQIKPEVWDQILQPALSDRKGWALFIGTPDGVNLFSKLFYDAKTPAKADDWHSALFTVYDTDALDPAEVARVQRDMSEVAFSREYLCDFTAAGDDQLISLSDVNAAMERPAYRPEDIAFAPRILGVDPARFGDDRSVILKRQGLMTWEPEVLHGIDNMALAARVAHAIEEFQPDAVFIDSGNGSGVIDRLRQLGYDVIEVQFGGKPTDPRYLNKRAEMWFELAAWVRAGGKLPRLQDMMLDLAAPKYWFDASGRRQLEPKDDIKARGLRSPDLGDALALTFAHPVHTRAVDWLRKRLEGQRTHNAPGGVYDPLALGREHDREPTGWNPYGAV